MVDKKCNKLSVKILESRGGRERVGDRGVDFKSSSREMVPSFDILPGKSGS